LDSAIIAVLGETVAFDLLKKKEFDKLMEERKTKEAEQFYKDAIKEFKNKATAENDCYSTGVLDWVIKDKNLREHLIKAMDKAEQDVKAIE
jgi:acetyl-CoA carboxylase carboxyltransferase component